MNKLLVLVEKRNPLCLKSLQISDSFMECVCFNTSVRQDMFCGNYVMGLVCLSVCLNDLSFLGLRYFFTYLLPHQAPPGLTHLVDHIMNSTGEDERRLDTMRPLNNRRSESESFHHCRPVMTRLALSASYNELDEMLHDMLHRNEYNLFSAEITPPG